MFYFICALTLFNMLCGSSASKASTGTARQDSLINDYLLLIIIDHSRLFTIVSPTNSSSWLLMWPLKLHALPLSPSGLPLRDSARLLGCKRLSSKSGIRSARLRSGDDFA